MARPEKQLQPTKKRQDRYLRARTRLGTLTAGCRAARVSPNTVYRWRKEDQADGYTAEEFRQLEQEAVDAWADQLEQEAYRRAVRGVREPVYYQGQVAGHIRRYSDTMLAMLLNGARPEKYQRHRHEVTGPGGGALRVEFVKPPEPEGD